MAQAALSAALSAAEIEAELNVSLDVEFSFIHADELAAQLVTLPQEELRFTLDWVRRIASTHLTLAHQFALRAPELLQQMDRRLIEAWAVHACDAYDRQGLRAALQVIEQVHNFVHIRHEHAAGALFEDIAPVLANFLRGLSGRRLRLEQGEAAYTDSERIFLPAVIAQMATLDDNFRLAKATVALLWGQTRYGSFRADLAAACAGFAEPERALAQLQALENIRIEACLGRELPGLHRVMQQLKAQQEEALSPEWQALSAPLLAREATLADSLRLLPQAYALNDPPRFCFGGELRPEAVAACLATRVEKEKMLLRVKLAELAEEHQRQEAAATGSEEAQAPQFEVSQNEDEERLDVMELTLDGAPVAPPQQVKDLLTSIQLDLGEIPDEYLVPAGPGDYDPSLLTDRATDPDAVWQGTYHEEGALFYPEWDYKRQHYRKNWCVMREKEVKPGDPAFHRATLNKYAGLLRGLRKSFEALRDEDRLDKRQTQGDEVDFDALIEAIADAADGREMSDRLFTRLHRAERNIAVAFMVDMSGSTRGWINEAEREALILLAESLERLGDRYAIYGFSGQTRKRCELFRIKTFDEPYSDAVRARIAGIEAQDYTRMGFAIRHLSKLLNTVQAKTRVLITLSDGKPDDYFDGYRGPYGIEDTRMALVEARRSGIHPFCITIDKEARDYLPHMYGAARYVILDEVRLLPMKVADIYRRLTT
ncbi:MAG: VWA domain-containing protein [Betaproteobacteria bacterium]|nr:VWA domain-containing protein [Betaproteobacteria bacterium]